tara:strand:+ start:5234 stop:5401 length:168 start_codon:yes stop_codon:yes gene_type:complete
MKRINELKQIIRENQPLADWGHSQAKLNVLNAKAQLKEITSNLKAQIVFSQLFEF